MIWIIGLLAAALTLALPMAGAQAGGDLLAYENASGQLVVAGGGGDFRWIVTNPNEPLNPTGALSWSPGGEQLLYSVQTGNGASLRVANPATQAATEVAAVNGPLTGGAWLSSSAVLAGTGQGVVAWDINTGNAQVIVPDGRTTTGQTAGPGGRFIFYQRGDQLATAAANGGNEVLLGRNNADAPGLGLWADSGAVVAYWAITDSGTAALGVANAQTGEVITLDTGSSIPVTPHAWLPGTLTLLYRSSNGLMALDASCIASGCSAQPAPVTVLPMTSAEVGTSAAGTLVYAANGSVFAADAGCIQAGTCTNAAAGVGNAGADSTLHVRGTTAAYTAANGVVHVFDTGCVSGGNCQPTATGLAGAVVGVSAAGDAVAVNDGQTLQVFGAGGAAVSLGRVRANSRVIWSGR